LQEFQKFIFHGVTSNELVEPYANKNNINQDA